ncbi:MAG: hypothetical protein KME07_20645 [Pegethrix bostrychoides GSE-TBD4-15B]|jgi:predicted negative regulator of RcsB-dependent stress response|uniref:Uncharacterized protein n=1 Tax=Pegethrix bostrychoides GSE-TBD4-15B TaxID=2839662 RepID=A0A951PED1_9CYAN|nr:hypothetical protein [Pegethrix bostrychoides GSE-TBD4-15B]
MTSDPKFTPDSAPGSAIEVAQTNALVDTELADQSDEIKRETKALIDALKLRAQTEVRSAENLARTATDYTRESYLKLVREARESVEQGRILDLQRIEQSAQKLQQEAEKNWQSLVQEMGGLSDRLSEAAKAAWEKLNQPPDS